MIWEAIRAAADRAPSRPAILLDGGEEITYAGLVARAEALARSLPARPEDRPGRVLLTQTDALPLLVQILACWRAGLAPVVAREGRDAAALEDLRRFIRPCAVLAGSLDAPILEADGPRPGAARAGASAQALGPRDEGLLLCTSGTTGAPKVVALPAEAPVVAGRAIVDRLGLRADDRIAVSTPLTYMYGLMGASVAGLLAGAALRLHPEGTPPPALLAAIRADSLTVVQGPPSLMRLFMAYRRGEPIRHVRIVTTGGEPYDAELIDRICDAFPDAEMQLLYGMTEAGPRISHRSWADRPVADGDVGEPFDHFEWRLDPVEEMDLPAGSGRLTLRGPTVLLGYLDAGGGLSGLDADGWFRSDDVLARGDDGRLRFVDRSDRLFKSGGKLVSPHEAEAVLRLHPQVRDAVCRSEAHPLLGRVLLAEVALVEGAEVGPKDLLAHCRGRLQPHALPRRIELRGAFGMAPSGKRRL